MFDQIIQDLKRAPTRLAERRERLNRRARERLHNARDDSAERLWVLSTNTLERVEGLLDNTAEVPVIGTVTAAANKLVHNRLEVLTALPVDGYADMNARDAMKAIKAIDARVPLCNLRRFESTHKARKTVLRAIEQQIEATHEHARAA